LRVFGLNSLDDLPETETILPDTGSGDQLSIAVEEENGDGEEAEPVDDAQLTLDDAQAAVEPSESTKETV
jgi:hypothetical protein